MYSKINIFNLIIPTIAINYFVISHNAVADGSLVYENFLDEKKEPLSSEIFVETATGKISTYKGQSIFDPTKGVVAGGVVEDGKQTIVVIETDDKRKSVSVVSDLKKDLISDLDSQDLIRARNKAQKKVEEFKSMLQSSNELLIKSREKAAKVVKIEDIADLKNELIGLKDNSNDPKRKSELVKNLVKEGYSDKSPVEDNRGELIEQLKTLSKLTASSESSAGNTRDAIIRDFERKLNLIKTNSTIVATDLMKELADLRRRRKELEQ